jgi:hypothetical protein
MKRAKRFYSGEEVEGKDYGGSSGSGDYAPAAPAKKQSFSEAFRNAEKGSTFEWEGKKYKKEYASDKKAESKPAPKSEPAPSKPTSKAEEPAKPAPKAEEPEKADKPKRGIGPYNVFAGPDEPDSTAVQAAKAAGAARRAKQASEPMMYNPFRGAIDAIRKRGKESNPEAYAKGGSVSSASKRADGIAQRGKTRGKMC